MTRAITLALLAAALVLAVAAGPAGAKEGVAATVLTPISRDAEPGTRVTVVWTLTFADRWARRPFNAEGVFVRVVGVRSRADYAGTQGPLGRYRAVIRVPGSGLRQVRFGLMGWNDDGPAPVFFPVRGMVFR